MFKQLTFFFTLLISTGINTYYSQVSEHISGKIEPLKYEFTFSAIDFQEVENMEQYITDITKAKEVLFDINNYKVIIKTNHLLESSIIDGKFKKMEVELLIFEKL